MGARVPVLQLARSESIRELWVFEQKRGGGLCPCLTHSYPIVRVSGRIKAQQTWVILGLLVNQVVLTVIKGAEPWGAAEPRRSRQKLLAI